MHSKFDEQLFKPHKKTENGSRILGSAAQEGKGKVEGSYNDLIASAELQVFKDLEIYPRKVVLPFDPNNPKAQKFQFRAKGGDGNYVWASQNPLALQISQNGMATTRVDSEMKATIQNEVAGSLISKHTTVKVALTKNTKIFRSAEVFFLPPVKLEVIKYNFETALKDYVKIHVGLSAYVNGSYLFFTKCENVNFDLEFSNQIFQLDSVPSDEAKNTLALTACHVLYLRSTSVGTTNLKISYKIMDKVLSDEVTLNVFEKLDILNPAENSIILPIGASRNVIYVNGPQRIFNLEAELMRTTKFDENIASITAIDFDSTKDIYAFTVLCKKVGETALNLNIFNSLSSPNFRAYVSRFVTEIFCVKPRFINLYATENLRSSCPIEIRNTLIPLNEHQNDGKFEIQIEVEDSKNRKLMNISSLVIDWEYAYANQKFQKDLLYTQHAEEVFIETVAVPGKNFLIANLPELLSNFKIKGIVSQYNQEVLCSYEIESEYPEFGIHRPKDGRIIKPVIENEINFLAVNSSMFSPYHISIFLSKNPERIQRVPINHGSGFFEIEVSEKGVVSYEFDQKTKEILLTPQRIGHIILNIFDKCLMNQPAQLSVSVVSIGSIRINVPDKVEKSSIIEAIVILYDSEDNLLNIDSNHLESYDLKENIFDSRIFSVKLADQENLSAGQIRYFLTGLELGETKLTVSSGSVISEPSTVQVSFKFFFLLTFYFCCPL